MINVRPNPFQYDININLICSYLNEKLQAKLGLSDSDILGYGRVYQIKQKGGVRPCAFSHNTDKDYKEVLFDDKLALMYFFGVDNSVQYKGAFGEIGVHLVFSANLKKIYADATRNDIELRHTILDLLYVAKHGFTLESENIGFNESLREYDGLKDSDMAKFDNHPNHIFRFNFNLRFSLHNKIN